MGPVRNSQHSPQPAPWTIIRPGMERAELLTSHVEHRKPPANLEPADESLFSYEFQRSWGPCEGLAFADLRVVGFSWLQLRHARFVDAYRPGYRPARRRRGRLKDLLHLLRPGQHVQEALWVHDERSSNYFHWICDVLPKLQLWLECGNGCRTVLLPQPLIQLSFVAESLEILGFQPIGFSRPELYIDKLIVIGPVAPSGNFRSCLLQQLRCNISQQLAADRAQLASRRLYISRADALRRFLRNESSLIPVLGAHHVEPVQLAGLSLSSQIRLFSECHLLVGLHGAGLTNMLWMPSGGHVIELRRRGDSHSNCYFAMASALGHTYSYVLAEDVRPDQDTHSAVLELAPVLLDECLQVVLKQSAV